MGRGILLCSQFIFVRFTVFKNAGTLLFSLFYILHQSHGSESMQYLHVIKKFFQLMLCLQSVFIVHR